MSIIDLPLKDQDVEKFGKFAEFITRDGALDLGDGDPNPDAFDQLSELEETLGSANHYTRCCLAAVWLFQDFLEESHTISQSIHSSEGSYLHGIMHRREGDFSNAKYWFRKAGDLGFFDSLSDQIQADSRVLQPVKSELERFDPILVTVLFSRVQGATKSSLERVSYWELLAVLEYCYDRSRENGV